MNSLINTSKQFKIIDKNIRNLITNVNSTIEKKLKLKEKTSSNKKPKKSKTQNNIHSNKFLSQTSSKKNIKSNFNIIHFTKRKASTNTENKVAAYTSLGYHIIDFKDSIEVGNKAKSTDSVLNDFKSYQNLLIEDELSAKDNLNASGVLKDSNLIFIQMEAIESLCMVKK